MALTDILSNPGETQNSSIANRGNVGVLTGIGTSDPNSNRLFIILPPPSSIIRGTIFGNQGEATATAKRPSRMIGM